LLALFTNLVVGGQNPVHRPLSGKIRPFVEQRCVDLRRCRVHEPRGMQHIENRGAFIP